MESPGLRQRLLAIMAADAVGYSRLMSIDDRATVDALDAARSLFHRHAFASGGRLVDTAGDSVLAVFETAAGAVRSALAVQSALAQPVGSLPDRHSMQFRVGIHVGDVLEKADGTVYGDGVNIAARLGDLAKAGGITVSQTVFSMVARRFDVSFEDIGEHSVKNIAQPIHAYRIGPDASTGMREVQGAGSTTSNASNLPQELPSLFGRDEDVSELVALVQAHRVVSIVGAGGIGKTRLAQKVASVLRGRWPDGAWIVELASISDPALLPATVAQALAIALPGVRSPQEEVLDAMRSRELLLVLDNCEHVIDAAGAFVDAVIRRTPHVRVLTTSQELLKVAGEHLYRVPALAVPTSTDLAGARHSAAVSLFVDRVARLLPGFVLNEENVRDAVEICRRLDGLPLAIELAAGRVPLLGATGVREKLHERFRVLTGGARVALRRHQTLRAALDWSHALLGSEERAVFRRAGVFSGSFTLAAAQHTAAGGDIDEWAVLEHLGALVDKSLVSVDSGEVLRYRLMESARAYALEKLGEAGETESTLRRHAEAVLALFERAHGEAWVVPILARVARCLPDIDNLRVALDWSAESDADRDLHVALASSSSWIWIHIGNFAEGRSRCERALARITSTTAPALEARMQAAWAHIAQRSAPSALGAGARAVALYRLLGDRKELYLALGSVAIMEAVDGSLAAAEGAVLEMAQLHDPGWPERSRWLLLFAQFWVLTIKCSDEYDEVERRADEMVQLARAARDAWLLHRSLFVRNLVAERRGQFELAARSGRELIDLIRRERWGEGNLSVALIQQVGVLAELGEVDEALDLAREAALRFVKSDGLKTILDTAALLAVKRGNSRGAALALGRADANRASGHTRRLPLEQRCRNRVFAELKRVLPAGELDRLLAEGAMLSNEEAVRIALSS